MKKIFIYLFIFLSCPVLAQEFGRKDSLRGFLFPERSCYDVTFYHLNINVDPENKFIRGYNEIHFEALDSFRLFQIDLFENMSISQIIFDGKELSFPENIMLFLLILISGLKKARKLL